MKCTNKQFMPNSPDVSSQSNIMHNIWTCWSMILWQKCVLSWHINADLVSILWPKLICAMTTIQVRMLRCTTPMHNGNMHFKQILTSTSIQHSFVICASKLELDTSKSQPVICKLDTSHYVSAVAVIHRDSRSLLKLQMTPSNHRALKNIILGACSCFNQLLPGMLAFTGHSPFQPTKQV